MFTGSPESPVGVVDAVGPRCASLRLRCLDRKSVVRRNPWRTGEVAQWQEQKLSPQLPVVCFAYDASTATTFPGQRRIKMQIILYQRS